jgi:cyclophilin family peptidyl-prolyl cis-trans isomerase
LAAVSRLAPTALVLAVALAACGSDDEKAGPGKGGAGTTGTTPTQGAATNRATVPATPARAPECRRVRAPRPRDERRIPRPTASLDPDRTYRAVVDTSCGRFTITLDVENAPRTAASFAHLARRGFYDDHVFHRIVPGFVIQGGDPTTTGQGGPGYSVVEPPPEGVRYVKYVVAMAKTEIEEPGTSGSQFYVVTAPDAQLPAEYALVGRVTSGQAVVDEIGATPAQQTSPDPSQRDRPARPVVIRSIRIRESR